MAEIPESRINERNISNEMRESFLDYAMSVIVSRALPDVRDGLKPVHRRILYGLDDQGLTPDKPCKKAARVIGDVVGKYHTHGDASMYETKVRMAQGFRYRYQPVGGSGELWLWRVGGAGAAGCSETQV
ncbi:DNA gyrase subunit A, partial [Staphylococcus chromogenes]